MTYYIENLKLQIQANDKKLKNLRQKFLVKRENRVFELNKGLFFIRNYLTTIKNIQ